MASALHGFDTSQDIPFITLTLEAAIPMESIAKMMGHTSISSTQIYAQITDSKISKDMDRLIEKVPLVFDDI